MSRQNPTTISCGDCREKLPCSDFSLNKASPTGRNFYCRRCLQEHYRQPARLAADKWRKIVRRVRVDPYYVNVELRVTRKEFLVWITPLLAAWNWDLQGSPSIDRIDVNGHYEFGNMQVISMSENIRKDRKNRKGPPGTKWCPGCNQYHGFKEFGFNRSGRFGLDHYCRVHRARLHLGVKDRDNEKARQRYHSKHGSTYVTKYSTLRLID